MILQNLFRRIKIYLHKIDILDKVKTISESLKYLL